MELELKKVGGLANDDCYIISDRYGKWFGDEMLLSKKSAELMKKAMEHANAVGQEEAQQKVRAALGLKW